jgi:hypothetical protein
VLGKDPLELAPGPRCDAVEGVAARREDVVGSEADQVLAVELEQAPSGIVRTVTVPGPPRASTSANRSAAPWTRSRGG